MGAGACRAEGRRLGGRPRVSDGARFTAGGLGRPGSAGRSRKSQKSRSPGPGRRGHPALPGLEGSRNGRALLCVHTRVFHARVIVGVLTACSVLRHGSAAPQGGWWDSRASARGPQSSGTRGPQSSQHSPRAQGRGRGAVQQAAASSRCRGMGALVPGTSWGSRPPDCGSPHPERASPAAAPSRPGFGVRPRFGVSLGRKLWGGGHQAPTALTCRWGERAPLRPSHPHCATVIWRISCRRRTRERH